MNIWVFSGSVAFLCAGVMWFVVANFRMRPDHTQSDYWRGLLVSHAAGVLVVLIAIGLLWLEPDWIYG